jgi:2-isopropylmalate synthase
MNLAKHQIFCFLNKKMMKKNKKKEKIIIFDTTLRDGEQAARGMLTQNQKLRIAKQLAALNVGVIEAGFPANSLQEFNAVRQIALKVRGPVICAVSHAKPEAIKRAWEAIKKAKRPRLHIFLSTSKIHLKNQLRGMTYREALNIARKMVALAKSYTEDIEFSPMDSTRTEPGFLYKIIEGVIKSGATAVNIADTVGYAVPEEFGALINNIFKRVPNIHLTTVSVHCHDDLGLAVSNSLAAIRAGARQVEGTINGIGERAGNASLEEIIMAIKTRQDFFPFETGINTRQIYKTSRLVSKLTGFVVPANKAIVGENAFCHASGIHQDGVLKEATTYEIIKPTEVGAAGSKIVLGKLSGRHALTARFARLGYFLKGEEVNKAFSVFQKIANKNKEVKDSDLKRIIRKLRKNKDGS